MPINAPALSLAVVETIRESLLVLDARRNVVFANRAFYETFRADPADTIGRSLFEIGGGQWANPRLAQLLDAGLPDGGAFERFEITREFQHLGTRTTLLTARALGEDAGRTTLLLIEDVTDQRALQRAVGLYTAELERSNSDLDHFASAASHDLQEPLRKVLAFGDRLRTLAGGALGPEGKDYLDRMGSAASRMQRLIDDLLTYARIARQPETLMDVDLDQVLADARGSLDMRIRESGANVVVQANLPRVRGNPVLLRLLFQNLLSNAIKYMPRGRNPEIHVSAELNGGLVAVSVQDNGIGVDAKYFERIFEPFERLHGREEFDGVGLGLAICRRIAERHAGRIAVQSSTGSGSRFTVTFPQAEAA